MNESTAERYRATFYFEEAFFSTHLISFALCFTEDAGLPKELPALLSFVKVGFLVSVVEPRGVWSAPSSLRISLYIKSI